MISKLRAIAICLIIFGIGLAVFNRTLFEDMALQTWVTQGGIVGPVVFIVLYAVATVFFLPGVVLTVSGGALFGPVLGTFYSLTGATLGACFSFFVSRYFLRGWINKNSGDRIQQLIKGVDEEGWRFVAMVRLVPLFPFNFLNYALGLTRIKLSQYVVATYICMLPGATAYTYLGYAGQKALAGEEQWISKGLFSLGLLAIIIFLPRLIQRIRQQMTENNGKSNS